MSAPTAKAIYEAARTAIYNLVVLGHKESSFMGMAKTAIDLPDLERIESRYKAEAVSNGELEENTATQRVTVSVPSITEN